MLKYMAFLLLNLPLVALPIGNPSDPALLSEGWLQRYGCTIRGGFYGDYVFNRYLQVDETFNESDIQDTRLTTNAAFATLNISQMIDLFATAGGSSIAIHTPSRSFRVRGLRENEFFDLKTTTGFSWSVGAKALLYEWNCFSLGAESQYFRTLPLLNYVKEEDDIPLYLNARPFEYQEWQVGLALSRALSISSIAMVPYMGIKWGWARGDMHDVVVVNDDIQTDTFDLYNLKNSKKLGYAVGLTLKVGGVSMMGERRFGDENGLQVNAQVRF